MEIQKQLREMGIICNITESGYFSTAAFPISPGQLVDALNEAGITSVRILMIGTKTPFREFYEEFGEVIENFVVKSGKSWWVDIANVVYLPVVNGLPLIQLPTKPEEVYMNVFELYRAPQDTDKSTDWKPGNLTSHFAAFIYVYVCPLITLLVEPYLQEPSRSSR